MVAQFRAWRVKEPVSNRRYTVVRLQSQGGIVGHGEGGPAPAAEIVAARAAVMDRRATESEYIRAALRGAPALEAAVSNAMLDLVSRAKTNRSTGIWADRSGSRPACSVIWKVQPPAEAAPSLERAKGYGIQAFTTAAPSRDAMIPLRAYVDLARQQYADMQRLAGASAEWVLDAAGAMTPADAASVAVVLERSHPIWFDEPTLVTTQDALAKIVDESTMPIALGRHITDMAAFQSLLAGGSVNIVRPDLGLNSLTKIKRVAAVAETHYVGIAPFHNGGPIGSMAGVHLNASILFAYAQQIPPASDRDAAMRVEIASGMKESGDKGFFALLNRPGLGFEVNERALDAWSEERI